MKPASAHRALRLAPAFALALLLAACAPGGADSGEVSLRVWVPEAGTEGPVLRLGREGVSLFGSWTMGGRYGLAEGEVASDEAFRLTLFSPAPGIPVMVVSGRFAAPGRPFDAEMLLVPEGPPGGEAPGGEASPPVPVPLRYRADPAGVAGLRAALLRDSTREGLPGDALEPTRFLHFAFEPTRPAPAAFRDWYRSAFQGGLALEKVLAGERDDFFSSFAEAAGLAAGAGEAVEAWDYEGRQFLVLSNDSLLVMGQRLATRTGGLSGSGAGGLEGGAAVRYAVIDRSGPSILGPGDVLVEGWEEALRPLLDEVAREELGLAAGASLTEAGFYGESLAPGPDFFLTAEGLGFDWDRFEIGPWPAGGFAFVVPYARLGALLKPGFLAGHGLASAEEGGR